MNQAFERCEVECHLGASSDRSLTRRLIDCFLGDLWNFLPKDIGEANDGVEVAALSALDFLLLLRFLSLLLTFELADTSLLRKFNLRRRVDLVFGRDARFLPRVVRQRGEGVGDGYLVATVRLVDSALISLLVPFCNSVHLVLLLSLLQL